MSQPHQDTLVREVEGLKEWLRSQADLRAGWPHVRYDLDRVIERNTCGTVCCIAGKLALDDGAEPKPHWYTVQALALKRLGFSSAAVFEDADRMVALFDPEAAADADVETTPENTIKALDAWVMLGAPLRNYEDAPDDNPWEYVE